MDELENNTEVNLHLSNVEDESDEFTKLIGKYLNYSDFESKYKNLSGRIINLKDKLFTVKLDSGDIIECQKAFSCLANPSLEDVVTLIYNDRKFYISHILESNNDLTIDEDFVHFKARVLNFTAKNTSIVSSNIYLNSQNYKSVSTTLDVSSLKGNFNYGNSIKHVTGVDRINALNIEYKSEFLTKLDSKTTVINGHDLFKIDGKLIMQG
ncbi:conserved hypothetical protein [Taylorella asinigenitalis 14/45]|uniref:Uncharacterized protein n=1 Tax=Taylorella asinigenitalis 14/45 TaxID=1091495 RepID=I7JNE0_9BURK|nr:DUF3540 domain-containing protein [Taylorella asinigenitalis]CCG20015.1 conserved hypothetical protein [Taylorella asinigenitalis 14/45]